MNQPSTTPIRATLQGGAWVLSGDALFVPTALIITAFLARRLGPAQYGLFALAATAAGWIEWVISSFFSRAAVRQVAAAPDWRPVGSAVVRVMLATSAGVGALLAIFAGPVGVLLGDRSLAPLLYLVAVGVPFVGLALSHRFVLTGLERFRDRAVATSVRWISRLGLVLVLVGAGFGAIGAIAATIGAATLEFVAARYFVRPAFLGAGPTPWRELGRLAMPLFLAAVSVRAFERADLICLQAFRGSTTETGLYGAAQSLASLPAFIAAAFAPVLLSQVTRLVAADDRASACVLSGQALRAVVWLVPVAGVVAVLSGEIVRLFFGQAYAGAAPVLAILSAASPAIIMLVMASTILVANDRAGAAVAIAAPLLPLAIVGHMMAVPRFGGQGAAIVTAVVSCFGACVALVVVKRLTGATVFGNVNSVRSR